MSQVRTRKRGKIFSYIFEAGKTNDGCLKVVEKMRHKKKLIPQELPPIQIGCTGISE